MKYIAVHDGNCGIGDCPDSAFSDLKENTSRDPDIEDVIFYRSSEIKVKQTIIIISDENDSNE